MKKIAIGLSLAICLCVHWANAQELPVPAGESHPEVTTVPEPVQANDVEEAVPQENIVQEVVDDSAARMIAFFDGLEKAVSGDNCQAISDAITEYCRAHQEWIDSLDYATGNLDVKTIQTIHEKARAFGKKLSVCYDQKSIPLLLRRYAGLGQEEL